MRFLEVQTQAGAILLNPRFIVKVVPNGIESYIELHNTTIVRCTDTVAQIDQDLLNLESED